MQVYVLRVDFKIEGKTLKDEEEKGILAKMLQHIPQILRFWFGIKKHAKSEI